MHCHQLYGTILLLPLYCPTAVGYLYQCKHKAPDNIWKTTCNALRNLYGRPSLCSDPISLHEKWLTQWPQRHDGAFVLLIFTCEPLPYANYHLKPAWQSCKPISDLKLLQILFSSQALCFLEGYIEKYLSATRYRLKVLHRIRRGSSSLTQGLHGPIIKDDRSR